MNSGIEGLHAAASKGSTGPGGASMREEISRSNLLLAMVVGEVRGRRPSLRGLQRTL